jgi:dipeptidyl-peptidase-4
MKPQNFDPTKKYPVFMHVYGGPGHNTVRNSWGGRNFLWHQYLTTQGYIVVSVDNRGTGNRGREFKHSTHMQLGKLELEDQTAAAQWFKQFSWVDSSRIGVWGWSFGGYLSSLCISKSPDVFKTAISVAPVTNWRYYDNIYTERFLQKPQDNPNGYDENSPINYVSGIRGNYLIVHGTGDDNVHFQNTTEMIHAMVKAGVQFDSEIYPNRNHGIGDRAAQYHLYRRMTAFVLENL